MIRIITSITAIFMSFFALVSLIQFPLVYAAATISTTNSSKLIPGNTFSLTIKENSQGDAINAVEIHLNYPTDKLDIISIDGDSGSFPINVSTTGENGSISIIRGVIGNGLTGEQQVATVIFHVKASANGTVSLPFGSVSLIRESDHVDVATPPAAISYQIETPTPTPTPFPSLTPTPVSETPTHSDNSHSQQEDKSIHGDFNKDSRIDIYDLSLLLQKWEKPDNTYDISHDGKVDIADFSMLLFYWGK